MHIYFVRHAEPVSKEEDPSLPLSDKGINGIRKVASFASEMGVTANQIIHSGKTRALQTAQILGDHLEIENGIIKAEGLAPMDDPTKWLNIVSDTSKEVILVGHLPHLLRLISLIICGYAEEEILDFETGCMVCMTKPAEGNGLLDWIIKPGMLK